MQQTRLLPCWAVEGTDSGFTWFAQGHSAANWQNQNSDSSFCWFSRVLMLFLLPAPLAAGLLWDKWRWNHHGSILVILLVTYSGQTSFLCLGLTWNSLKLHLLKMTRPKREELMTYSLDVGFWIPLSLKWDLPPLWNSVWIVQFHVKCFLVKHKVWTPSFYLFWKFLPGPGSLDLL